MQNNRHLPELLEPFDNTFTLRRPTTTTNFYKDNVVAKYPFQQHLTTHNFLLQHIATYNMQQATGLGGKGLGKNGSKRHRNNIRRDNIKGITKPAIRRLARRGGVKRIGGQTYEEIRGVLRTFLENVLHDSITYTEHAKRKTVTSLDVVYALRRQGRTLYGFGH